MAAPVLKFKRGKLVELPSLAVGEPGFTTDKYDLYLGYLPGVDARPGDRLTVEIVASDEHDLEGRVQPEA